jgi:flagellar basal body-associated protein FliL
MPRKKKVIIAISIFIAIAAIVGIAVGLYFHFRPTSNHVYTVVSQGNDGTVHSATKF